MSANFQQNPIYEKRCNTYWNKHVVKQDEIICQKLSSEQSDIIDNLSTYSNKALKIIQYVDKASLHVSDTDYVARYRRETVNTINNDIKEYYKALIEINDDVAEQVRVLAGKYGIKIPKTKFRATHDDSFWNNDYVLYQQYPPIQFDETTLELFPDLQYL